MVYLNDDFEKIDIEKLDTHGGSLRYYIKRANNNKIKIENTVSKQISTELKFGLGNFSTYLKFGNSVKKSKNDLLKLLKTIKKKNQKIIGYGATAKASTVLNYCNIGNDMIDYFVDTTPDKKNRYMPGKNIKIKKSEAKTSIFLFIIDNVLLQYLYDVFDAPKINILEL